jgi:hypothetical protein
MKPTLKTVLAALAVSLLWPLLPAQAGSPAKASSAGPAPEVIMTDISHSVIKMSLAEGVKPEAAAEAMLSKAAELNMKLVGRQDVGAELRARGIDAPVYSDSVTALAWVRDKRCKTELVRSEKNAPLFALVERAEGWLREDSFTGRALKWDTEAWGENPADFGRK